MKKKPDAANLGRFPGFDRKTRGMLVAGRLGAVADRAAAATVLGLVERWANTRNEPLVAAPEGELSEWVVGPRSFAIGRAVLSVAADEGGPSEGKSVAELRAELSQASALEPLWKEVGPHLDRASAASWAAPPALRVRAMGPFSGAFLVFGKPQPRGDGVDVHLGVTMADVAHERGVRGALVYPVGGVLDVSEAAHAALEQQRPDLRGERLRYFLISMHG